MLLAHAVTLAQARSYVAALADVAGTFDASVEYERVLLKLDWIHGDDSPALDTAGLTDDRDILFAVATSAIVALLAATLHRLNVDHPSAVVLFAGTGLPFTPDALRKAGVTHPDRLFVLESIPLTLEHDDARYAVVEPARQASVVWTPEAAAAVVEASNGYPAHLQLFAHATWTAAAGPDQITLADVENALPRVAAQLERRTLGPRWDRISDRQMEFLAALAMHGGRASTAAIAATLGRTQQELSWLREELIEEGDIYAPKRGQLAMAVPLFNRYVLSHYERTRPEAATALLSLEEMIANAGLDASAIGNGNPNVLRRDRQNETRQLPPPGDTPGPRRS